MHAPVLGPGSWAPVAGELTRRGLAVVVPSLTGFTGDGPPYAGALLRRLSAQLPGGDEDAVLVAHSGACVFAPYVADALGDREVSVILADGGLPPVTGPGRVVEESFLPVQRGLADDAGIVPPWPQWWPEDALAAQFPDEATRKAVSAEAGALPLAFFAETLPPRPASWQARRVGYLRFSEGYVEEAREAAARGWPVREMAGEHLHMLVDPAGVATAITGLAAELRS
jgi:hypothetical protein